MASRQNCATSALVIEPASPSMTLMTPVGGSTVSPPGRTMHHSSPEASTTASWAFLSLKMELITVDMSILKKNGAWSLLSPAPMDVTTATLFTPASLMASSTTLVPSCSMVFPTSDVFPPSAITQPSTSPPSNTFLTSPALVTLPPIIVRFGSDSGEPAEDPPLPLGTTRFEGLRVRPTTESPFFSAWYTHSDAVKPDAPKTAIFASSDVEDGAEGGENPKGAGEKAAAKGSKSK
mmetsp:Transcript_19555/g.40529  ORF Transcript_19555/g.40529 Transcript_19555/m.40529 type:complete len:235 (-) Transcript_19555:1620-2324(-)